MTEQQARSDSSEAPVGALEPLRERVFATLWVATVLGNTGSFMRDVASSWMATELSANPAAVAAVQAAAALPVFLFAIPAGVLSDILDRRRFLIAVQILLAAVSAALMVLSASSSLRLESLLALTFIGGLGAALMGPAWLSIVPTLVSGRQLRAAVALNSLGVNISRAIGPAAGGALLAAFGAAVTYGVDLLTYALVISALLWWRPPPTAPNPLAEQFIGALQAGLRFTLAQTALHRVLWRAAVFFVSASAAWALLPLVARQLLQGSAGFYGLMLGAVGLGAIIGALALPRLRHLLAPDGLMLLAAMLSAVVLAALAMRPPQGLALLILLVLGVAWIVALTTLNALTQSILPDWVRGRGLSVYLTVFNGALAAGSLGWGAVAHALGLPTTLLLAAVVLALGAVVTRRWPLPSGEGSLAASQHWPTPPGAHELAHHRGPVLVQVEYQVLPADRAAFVDVLRSLSIQRRSDGASAWDVYEDSANPHRLVECFFVSSWAEHLRQHQRVSQASVVLQARVRALHQGLGPPEVSHFISLSSIKKEFPS